MLQGDTRNGPLLAAAMFALVVTTPGRKFRKAMHYLQFPVHILRKPMGII